MRMLSTRRAFATMMTAAIAATALPAFAGMRIKNIRLCDGEVELIPGVSLCSNPVEIRAVTLAKYYQLRGYPSSSFNEFEVLGYLPIRGIRNASHVVSKFRARAYRNGKAQRWIVYERSCANAPFRRPGSRATYTLTLSGVLVWHSRDSRDMQVYLDPR